jgi:hypothetical protein
LAHTYEEFLGCEGTIQKEETKYLQCRGEIDGPLRDVHKPLSCAGSIFSLIDAEEPLTSTGQLVHVYEEPLTSAGSLQTQDIEEFLTCEGSLSIVDLTDVLSCEGTLSHIDFTEFLTCGGTVSVPDLEESLPCEGTVQRQNRPVYLICRGILLGDTYVSNLTCQGSIWTQIDAEEVLECTGTFYNFFGQAEELLCGGALGHYRTEDLTCSGFLFWELGMALRLYCRGRLTDFRTEELQCFGFLINIPTARLACYGKIDDPEDVLTPSSPPSTSGRGRA